MQYGHPMFHQLVEEIRDLHERKNRQYATQDDPLGNFRRTGQIIKKMLKPGIDPTLASCLAFMSKQVDGVYEIFGESKTDTIDSLEDKLLDIAVYSIIGMILVRESRAKGEVKDGPYCTSCGDAAEAQHRNGSHWCWECTIGNNLTDDYYAMGRL